MQHVSNSDDVRVSKTLESQISNTFLERMSHDLRAPLNVVLVGAQLMARDEKLSPDHENYLRMIYRNAQRMLSLIDYLLDVALVNSGSLAAQSKAIDVREFLEAVNERFATAAKRKGLEFEISSASELPRIVSLDADKLQRVLTNLLDNAIQFTNSGRIALSVTHDRHGHADRLVAEVADTGVGIAPEAISSLFTPHNQGDRDRKPRTRGAGLGIYLSYRLVQIMGGEISVTSQVGTGSVFRVAVPYQVIHETLAPPSRRERKVIGIRSDRPGPKILVVDDDDDNRDLTVKLLESVGFQVHSAQNGLEAIDQWTTWKPRLILMDMRMPIMDGYEATRKIKASANGESPVIVAMTASVLPEKRMDVLSTGCDDLIAKPYLANDVFEVIGRRLEVDYVYAEPKRVESESTTEKQPVPTSSFVRYLASNMADRLLSAASQADSAAIGAIIAQIGTTNPAAAEQLRDLADDYQYDTIIRLMKECGARPPS